MTGIPFLIAMSRPSSVQMTVAPDPVYPVTLEQVKQQLRIDNTDEDVLLQGFIAAATEYAQGYTWSQFITATFVERRDYFPAAISPMQLARNPSPSVTSIQYIDTAGVTQTLDPSLYVVDPYIVPALIVPAYTRFWPTTRWHVNDVTVTYTAGYGSIPESVPQEIRQAILLKVSQLFWGRGENGVSKGSDETIKTLLDLRSFRTFY